MQKRTWRKKGFTLIELTVVIAVLAIISTVIVTFSSLISAQVTRSNARADFLRYSSAFKTDLQTAFAEFDSDTVFTVSIDNENNVLSFGDDNKFVFDAYGEFSLSVETKENSSLLKCIMKNQSLGLEQTFLISSRCGARFMIGGSV